MFVLTVIHKIIFLTKSNPDNYIGKYEYYKNHRKNIIKNYSII